LTNPPHIYVALPVMDEAGGLPVILNLLKEQTFRDFTLVVCVNQPDGWWDDPEKSVICETNAHSLALLNSFREFRVEVIDCSSRGSGWRGRKHGVGWARKTVMDQISGEAASTDIILSLDADTVFCDRYLESVVESLITYPTAMALSIPYYHRLPDDPVAARAILRYEIYMRHYLLNLFRIGSPYAFTALGSAMAFPVWAYRKVGGMTPKLSGEDFYFLQKLRKGGALVCRNRETLYPEARFSSRVFFGTGPAMIRGARGDWGSYPIYSSGLFDDIGESYRRFPDAYAGQVETPVTGFLREMTGEADPFGALRKNATDEKQFVRACHEKFDGLRILQYLKQKQKTSRRSDEENLTGWFHRFYPDFRFPLQKGFSFNESSLDMLDGIRNFLFREESRLREAYPLLK